ncbi:tRNA1(Val) (adenine(37)-N6)-methyltransferase [Roseiterribacter gracilis]
MTNADARPATSTDTLLNGRVQLIQPTAGYRAAIDPVLLAAAVPARAGETVLELGCGVGAALFCLAARVPDIELVGVESDAETARLARENASANGVGARVQIVHADVGAAPAGAFARVLLNPPYLEAGAHDPSPEPRKAKAHCHVDGDDLARWINVARTRLVHRGTLSLIHRADRLAVILAALDPYFGDVRILPLWPKRGVAAKRVLVQAAIGSRAPSSLLPGLVLHQDDGAYSDAARAILWDGAALPLEAP